MVTTRHPRSLPPRETLDGLEVIRRLYPNLLPSPGRRTFQVLAKYFLAVPLALYEFLYLGQHLLRRRPDVVNAHYFSYPVAYCMIACRLLRIPLVLCFHGSDAASAPYPATYRWTARLASIAASRIIACSQDLAMYVNLDVPSKHRHKVTVAHYGVDINAHVSAPSGEGCRFFLLPARLVEKKGIDIAIMAVAELHNREIPVRLRIAGDGPLGVRFRRLVRDLGLEEEVEFVGNLSPEAMKDVLSRAEFVVVPSLWEAFGMVCLEAMAAGKAVIATRNGGPSEIVVDGQTGILVPPGEVLPLAEAISRLWADRAQAGEMGRLGRIRAGEHFKWSQMAERYEHEFRLAIAGQ